MPTALSFGKDAHGFITYGPKPSTLKQMVELSNGNVQSYTLPADADWYTVSFRYQAGTTVWVDVSGSDAEYPILGTFSETTSEMNPATLTLAGGTEISVITPNDTAQVCLVIWQGGNP